MQVNRDQNNLLKFSDEVLEALNSGKPVVALESTYISHGLPYPENVATARRISEAVRIGGAVPATIGIADGRFLIGMTEADIDRLVSAPNVPKVSSRDIAPILAKGELGATTIASALVAADLATIPFFASAGIGGVHRGAAQSMDISADLTQFTRSKVAVVCAGAKSILDLGLTLEYLETQGVPIIAHKCDDFPAFYSYSSGLRLPHRLDDEEAIACAIEKHWQLGSRSSILIASPIKKEDGIDHNEIEDVIDQATRQAEKDGVSGPAISPYLMKAVSKATAGRSVKANMSVVISTSELAGRLAKAHTLYLQKEVAASMHA
jgi:pseudouridine-5'-phosphate glycosidase